MKKNGLSRIDVAFRIENQAPQSDDGLAHSIALLIDENEKLRRMAAFLTSQTEQLRQTILGPELRDLH